MMWKLFLAILLTASCALLSRAQTSPAPTPATTSAGAPSPEAVDTGAKTAASAAAEVASAGEPRITLPPEKLNSVTVKRLDSKPVIDGALDDEAWKQATVLKDFYQTQPGDNIAPSYPTEVRIGFDSTHLYIGFHAFDDPKGVRATLAKRDAVLNDDYVAIFLDTFNDRRKAYAFFFNPLGVQQDAVFTEDREEDFTIDVVMQSQGRITADGYTVEVAIPFKSLRYEVGPDKFWGIHIFRRIKRLNNEQSSWMPLYRDRSGFLNQAGRIGGIEAIATGRTVEIIPSLTLLETGSRVRTIPRSAISRDPTLVDPGRFTNGPIDVDPGVTAKLGITPNVTLALAVNPDFAQVEADQLVVTANQRFPIFFEERRPFFLEGAEIFQTRISAVHTRAIVDPDVAVKLTGKRGRHTFGLLLASDNGPGTFVGDERLEARNQRFLDKNAYIGVLRLKRDIGKENSLGLIATTYSFIEKHNHLGGVDGRFRLDEQTIFDFQVLGTTTRRFFYDPDLDESVYRTGNGVAYYYNLDRTGRNFSFNLNGFGRSPFYRSDVGFLRRVNTNNERFRARYKSEPKTDAKLVTWNIQNATDFSFDWQGRSQLFNNSSQLSLSFQRQGYFTFGYDKGYERTFEEEFGANRTPTRAGAFTGDDPERSAYRSTVYVIAGVTPNKKYSLSLYTYYSRGTFDFDLGAGPRFPRVSPAALLDQDAPFDPGPGNEFYLNGNITYQPTPKLRASLDYTKNHLVRHDTGLLAFDDNIYSLRTTYQFTRFTFARARVDYTSLSLRYRGQFLLGWTPNPGTSFYVGYNDDLNRNGFSPFTNQVEPGFRRNGRTFFVKMSYLFRRSL
jgi:hypothetical protein